MSAPAHSVDASDPPLPTPIVRPPTKVQILHVDGSYCRRRHPRGNDPRELESDDGDSLGGLQDSFPRPSARRARRLPLELRPGPPLRCERRACGGFSCFHPPRNVTSPEIRGDRRERARRPWVAMVWHSAQHRFMLLAPSTGNAAWGVRRGEVHAYIYP